MPDLQVRQTPGAQVVETSPGDWRLSIPAGTGSGYRWAQLDDYMQLPRKEFAWAAPLRLELRARVSAADLPGTWGFGLWNDPFTAGLGLGGTARRLPALPNTAWFFHASPPNYLALQDHHPAVGMLAATFSARGIPTALLALGALAVPLLAWRPTARWLRRWGRNFVRESAERLELDVTEWHDYTLEIRPDGVRFGVDGAACCETQVSPRGRLGVVIWIDNQYAAFRPDGKLSMGVLANEAAWLEISNIRIQP